MAKVHVGKARVYVSAASEGAIGRTCYEVNEPCHGHRGGVSLPKGIQAADVVMTAPRVYAIYWDGPDKYFAKNPSVITIMESFFNWILTGTYMDQLQQYGVGPGTFLPPSPVMPWDPTILPKQLPPVKPGVKPAKVKLHPDQIVAQLEKWIAAGTVVQPQSNLLYVIFTPSNTNIGDCLAGFHGGVPYYPSGATGPDNLFWAAIQEWHEYGLPHGTPWVSLAKAFADSCTWAVSHEMVEAFTNPDGVSGWAYRPKGPDGHPTGTVCEIGDLCECAMRDKHQKSPILRMPVDDSNGWIVESYWDNQNNSCYPFNTVPREVAPRAGYGITKPNENPQGRRV